MSMLGDLLTAATPTRLVCHRGTWSLELERFVCVERNVYQPRLQRVEGSDAIVQHLKRVAGNPPLANAASVLLRSTMPNEECAFEAIADEWVACDPSARQDSARASARPPSGPAAAELGAELCLVRAVNEGLRARVARLEAQLALRQDPREVIRSEGSRVAVPRCSEAPRATALSVPPVPEVVTVHELVSTEARPPASPPSAAPPSEVKLKLPTASVVSACLARLVGKKLGVSQLKSSPSPARAQAPCWFSRLVDDAGDEVGVIVADLLATVGLGGALMMLLPAELAAQRAAQTPSDDVISAMAEVANILSATFNQQPDALHVRVRPLEPMTPGSLDWTNAPALAVAFELAGDLGHLFLFAR